MTLEYNRDAVWAQEHLDNRGGSLPSRSIYVLTLLATHGDRKKAEKAWLKRYTEELRRGGETPEIPDF